MKSNRHHIINNDRTLHRRLFANVKRTSVKRGQNNVDVTLSTFQTIFG